MADAEDHIEALEEALARIMDWSDAYPLDAFPEPDAAYFQHAREVLEANGMSLSVLSAAAMRHCLRGVRKIAADALGAE